MNKVNLKISLIVCSLFCICLTQKQSFITNSLQSQTHFSEKYKKQKQAQNNVDNFNQEIKIKSNHNLSKKILNQNQQEYWMSAQQFLRQKALKKHDNPKIMQIIDNNNQQRKLMVNNQRPMYKYIKNNGIQTSKMNKMFNGTKCISCFIVFILIIYLIYVLYRRQNQSNPNKQKYFASTSDDQRENLSINI